MWAVGNGSRVSESVESSTSLAQTIPNAHGFEFIIALPPKPAPISAVHLKMI